MNEDPEILELPWNPFARRILRRGALRHAANVLRRLGYLGAALALELEIEATRAMPSLSDFEDEDTELTIVLDTDQFPTKAA